MPDIVATASILSDRVFEEICRARELIGDNPAFDLSDVGVLQNPDAAKQAIVEAVKALTTAAAVIEGGAWPTASAEEGQRGQVPE